MDDIVGIYALLVSVLKNNAELKQLHLGEGVKMEATIVLKDNDSNKTIRSFETVEELMNYMETKPNSIKNEKEKSS